MVDYHRDDDRVLTCTHSIDIDTPDDTALGAVRWGLRPHFDRHGVHISGGYAVIVDDHHAHHVFAAPRPSCDTDSLMDGERTDVYLAVGREVPDRVVCHFSTTDYGASVDMPTLKIAEIDCRASTTAPDVTLCNRGCPLELADTPLSFKQVTGRHRGDWLSSIAANRIPSSADSSFGE